MNKKNLLINRCVFVATLASVLLALMVGFSTPVDAQTTHTANLKVLVTGARNTKGKIRAALFQSAEGFPGDTSRAVQTQAAAIDPQTMSAEIVFTNLPSGNYAVALFHDENMNQKLDKNFLGMPKEGYGASNNPKKRMGPPKFEEAKFELNLTGRSLEIGLTY